MFEFLLAFLPLVLVLGFLWLFVRLIVAVIRWLDRH